MERLFDDGRVSARPGPLPVPGTVLHRGNRTVITLVNHPTYGICVEKRLLSFCDVETERTALIREARLQREASSPGIVSVLGIEDERFFRSYVQGFTLREALGQLEQGQGFSPLEMKTVVKELTRTVCTLHAGCGTASARRPKRIVHRDLTLGNLYLNTEGKVLLSDFGLAFHPDFDLLQTDELLLGTPKFLAPELLAADLPSPATDIYQIALIAACLLAPALRLQSPSLPPSLKTVRYLAEEQSWHGAARELLEKHGLADCLDPEPAERPSCQELLGLLDQT